MASVVKQSNGRYRARFYDASGKQHSRNFVRKADAERWVTDNLAKVNRGDWTDPARGRVTVEEWGKQWLASKVGLKETTQGNYRSIWETHVKPTWGEWQLSEIGYANVLGWVAELTGDGLGPSRIRQCLLALRQILDLAVLDGRIARNPTTGIKPPKAHRSEAKALTIDQLYALADECASKGEQYRTYILVAGLVGLRYGEMRALRLKRVDLMRCRLTVAENLPYGASETTSPKSHARRVLPFPKSLRDPLTVQLAGRRQGDLVWSAGGSSIDISNFRRDVFDPACAALGLDGFTPHNLRDTAASLAISQGANVLAVARMLGHADASITLRAYSHMFPSDLDAVADRLDALKPASNLPRKVESS